MLAAEKIHKNVARTGGLELQGETGSVGPVFPGVNRAELNLKAYKCVRV